MYCKFCGKQIGEEGRFCPHCGRPLSGQEARGGGYAGPCGGFAPPPPGMAWQTEPRPSAGWAVLCFLFPLVGLILYLVWMDTYPLRAKMCGKGALIALIVYAALVIFWIALVLILIAIGTSTALSLAAAFAFL